MGILKETKEIFPNNNNYLLVQEGTSIGPGLASTYAAITTVTLGKVLTLHRHFNSYCPLLRSL